jgi:predicted nucleotidyltransferase component of viral defense system
MNPTELQARASQLGVDVSTVAKDHVLNHVLAAIAESEAAVHFRGGTALARVYWPDYRLSEDLDFVTSADTDSLRAAFGRALSIARERTGFALELEFNPPAHGYAQSLVRWNGEELKLDINAGEQPRMPPQVRELDLPYSDLADARCAMSVVAVEEILANKWYMLDDRNEARDLYDLWAGLCRFDLPFDSIAAGYRARYATSPMRWRLDRARRREADWDNRLAHQLNDLPTFDEAWSCVALHFDAWEKSVLASE